MTRLVMAVDPAVGVEPAALAKAWDGDEEAAALGGASTGAPRRARSCPDWRS